MFVAVSLRVGYSAMAFNRIAIGLSIARRAASPPVAVLTETAVLDFLCR
jgi:hypothetical protein